MWMAKIMSVHAYVEPGVITNWHTHPRGQFLYVLSGVGFAQRDQAVPWLNCAREIVSGSRRMSAIGTEQVRPALFATSAFKQPRMGPLYPGLNPLFARRPRNDCRCSIVSRCLRITTWALSTRRIAEKGPLLDNFPNTCIQGLSDSATRRRTTNS